MRGGDVLSTRHLPTLTGTHCRLHTCQARDYGPYYGVDGRRACGISGFKKRDAQNHAGNIMIQVDPDPYETEYEEYEAAPATPPPPPSPAPVFSDCEGDGVDLHDYLFYMIACTSPSLPA